MKTDFYLATQKLTTLKMKKKSIKQTISQQDSGFWIVNCKKVKFLWHINIRRLLMLKSSFKWRLTGLNSKFSFSLISCHTKVKKPGLPHNLQIDWKKIVGFITFLALYDIYIYINDYNLNVNEVMKTDFYLAAQKLTTLKMKKKA